MDGTTDTRTTEIFSALKHPKLLKWASETNRGPYPMRNKAFELTRTPFHFYLDADDQLGPSAVADALKAFKLHPNAGFVYTDYQCVGSGEEIIRYAPAVEALDLVEGHLLPGACAYYRTLWEKVGGFAEELARGNADYDFVLGAYEMDVRGVHDGGVNYHYRRGQGSSVSNSYGLRYAETHEIMVRRHPRFFKDPARRRRFLALGYRRGACANYSAGNWQRASALAAQACRNGLWKDPYMIQIVLRGRVPPAVFAGLRLCWRLARPPKRVLKI